LQKFGDLRITTGSLGTKSGKKADGKRKPPDKIRGEVIDKLPYRPIVNLLFAAESDRLSPCPLRCVQHDL